MEWNPEMCLQVIEEYRKTEVLWKPRNSFYYSKLKKEDCWAEIAALFKTNINEIKKKVDSLKSSYRREKTRVRKSFGTGKARNAIYESKWFAYDAFKFLEDKDEPRKTTSNVESPSIESEDLACEEELSQTHESEDESSSQTTTESLQTEPPKKVFQSPQKRRPMKRRVEDPRIDEAFSYLKEATNASKKQKDKCSLFGEFIAEKLRLLDSHRQTIAEHQIHNILFQLEMSSHRDSGHSNYGDSLISPSQQPYSQPMVHVFTPTQYNLPSTSVAPPSVSPQDNKSGLGEYFSSFSASTSDSY